MSQKKCEKCKERYLSVEQIAHREKYCQRCQEILLALSKDWDNRRINF